MAEIFKQIFSGFNLAILGAALATILAGIGSAKGVYLVATAASGLLSENPSAFGKCIVLEALPMTQGIYGLITSFMILFKIGVIGGSPMALETADGAYFLLAALPIAIVGLYSGIKQGKVAASGVVLLTKQPNELGHAMTNAALVETYAIFAVLVSLLLILFR